ncbi:hypothetical protein GGS26DRAFT_569318 [Hypomontagnella submonticulosa]|nr:hypothetical protein GGS26DRAFT_569318 [Hypomontagnella submonticulosa]
MPTYLCHGFRWHRRSIRYFVVIQNVDDAAPEWIVARHSSVALLDQFYELFDFLPPCKEPTRIPSPSPNRANKPFPTSNGDTHVRTHSHGGQDKKEKNTQIENGENGNGSQQSKSTNRSKTLRKLNTTQQPDDTTTQRSPDSAEPDDSISFNQWSVVKFLEEFDPSDLSVVSGEWAYVADYVVRVDTSVSVTEEISRYEARMKTDRNKAMSGPSDEAGRRIQTIGNKKAGWFEKLRDQLQRSETIRWYVVVCGDEDRDGHELAENEGDGVNGVENTTKRQSPYTFRGIIENGFEFRLPEFLTPRDPEQGPRRRRAERKAKQNPTPAPGNNQPTIPPPPAPIQVAHKMSIDNAVRPKSSRSSSGFRRLLWRRKTDGPT